ncbi:MAG: sigma-70 family RNA polymerase sigma factor [Clostridia bacterium]|nr:sigma-70 family RNA polymerase sigma factor [Clostridia bacterium]
MNRDSMHTTPEDAEIIEMLWRRSEEGLSWVERKYSRLCYRIAMNLLGRHEDAEECVNDVYLAVWDTIPPNRPDSLMAYVGKVTRNIAVNCLRKREATKRKCGGTVLLDELSECLPDTEAPDPADELTLRDALESFLTALSAEDRAIMLRRYYDGDPIEEIARDVGLRAGTVRTRLHRLRERLREHLESNGITL